MFEELVHYHFNMYISK